MTSGKVGSELLRSQFFAHDISRRGQRSLGHEGPHEGFMPEKAIFRVSVFEQASFRTHMYT